MIVRAWLAVRRYTALAAALALGGCSGVLVDPPLHQANPYETVQLFYRPLAEAAVRPLVGETTPIEIAELRPSIAPQPGDWSACVKTWKDGQPRHYAVFFWERAVYDVRPATMIDRCEDGERAAIETVAARR